MVAFTDAGQRPVNISIKQHINVVRLGTNYRFVPMQMAAAHTS